MISLRPNVVGWQEKNEREGNLKFAINKNVEVDKVKSLGWRSLAINQFLPLPLSHAILSQSRDLTESNFLLTSISFYCPSLLANFSILIFFSKINFFTTFFFFFFE
jgi:hypothetical protein